MADWVGGAGRTLRPLVEALKYLQCSARRRNCMATMFPFRCSGRATAKTKTSRLWTYVRDDRPASRDAASAVWFAYSPDRKGEHPARTSYRAIRGVLQAGGCAGFNKLYHETNWHQG